MEAVESNSWSEEILEANVRVWTSACAEVTNYAPYADLPAEKLDEYEPAATHAVEFAQYCAGLINPETGQPNEDVIQQLRSASSGPGSMADYHWSRNSDVHAVGDIDLVKDLALSELDRSLRSMDEVNVRGALFELLEPQISDLVRLPPELADRRQSYASFYLPLVHPTAAALICQEAGGCYGEDHPMVLRTCMGVIGQRMGCVDPNDLMDALYQSQTPVEHRLFWSLFNQVNAMLAAYRRSTSREN